MAAAACVYFSAAAWIVVSFRQYDNIVPSHQHEVRNYSCAKLAAMCCAWLVITLVLSTPSILFALSTAVPGDENTLGISSAVLKWSASAAGVILFVISAIIIPTLARALPKKLGNGEADLALSLRFIMFANFVVALVR